MIWIRIFITVILFLMAIYYAMLILQCLTSWFRMTNRDITFGRCIIPFYYWIAPVEERKKSAHQIMMTKKMKKSLQEKKRLMTTSIKKIEKKINFKNQINLILT